LPDGWGGDPYFDENVLTMPDAADAATAIGQAVWGALGTLTWQTDGVAVGGTAITRFHQGDIIEIEDPYEGQSNHKYPIRHVEEVAGSTGHPEWVITVGDEPPDVLDLIRGITVIRPIQQQLRGGGGMSGAAGETQGQPGTPRQVATSRTPTSTARNKVVPQYNDTTALTLQGTVQDRNPDVPVDPEDYAVTFAVRGAVTESDPAPKVNLWGSHEGQAHPYTVDFGYLSTNGTYGTHVPYALRMRHLDLKGVGTVELQRNAITVAGPYTASGARLNQPIDVTYAAGDDLHIVTTSIADPGLSVKVTEIR
jgi:hypothetical protein